MLHDLRNYLSDILVKTKGKATLVDMYMLHFVFERKDEKMHPEFIFLKKRATLLWCARMSMNNILIWNFVSLLYTTDIASEGNKQLHMLRYNYGNVT